MGALLDRGAGGAGILVRGLPGVSSGCGLFGDGWSWDCPLLHLHDWIRAALICRTAGDPSPLYYYELDDGSPPSGPHAGSRYSFSTTGEAGRDY